MTVLCIHIDCIIIDIIKVKVTLMSTLNPISHIKCKSKFLIARVGDAVWLSWLVGSSDQITEDKLISTGSKNVIQITFLEISNVI